MTIKQEMRNKVVQACNAFNKYRKLEGEIDEILDKYYPELKYSDEFTDSISTKLCYGAYDNMKEFWRDIELLQSGRYMEIGEG